MNCSKLALHYEKGGLSPTPNLLTALPPMTN
nr:MAG TPA: hypothetical protein [Caudoviricetes sp.]